MQCVHVHVQLPTELIGKKSTKIYKVQWNVNCHGWLRVMSCNCAVSLLRRKSGCFAHKELFYNLLVGTAITRKQGPSTTAIWNNESGFCFQQHHQNRKVMQDWCSFLLKLSIWWEWSWWWQLLEKNALILILSQVPRRRPAATASFCFKAGSSYENILCHSMYTVCSIKVWLILAWELASVVSYSEQEVMLSITDALFHVFSGPAG